MDLRLKHGIFWFQGHGHIGKRLKKVFKYSTISNSEADGENRHEKNRKPQKKPTKEAIFRTSSIGITKIFWRWMPMISKLGRKDQVPMLTTPLQIQVISCKSERHIRILILLDLPHIATLHIWHKVNLLTRTKNRELRERKKEMKWLEHNSPTLWWYIFMY